MPLKVSLADYGVGNLFSLKSSLKYIGVDSIVSGEPATISIADRIILPGVGAFAEQRAAQALAGIDVRIGRVLHPSPASPAANRGWSEAATRQLVELGVWR